MCKASEIIDTLLDELNLNPKSFADSIGLDRPQAIYDIQKGKTKSISSSMVNKILSVYPQFNMFWLLTGNGPMLKDSAFISTATDQISMPKEVFDLIKSQQETLLSQQRTIETLTKK